MVVDQLMTALNTERRHRYRISFDQYQCRTVDAPTPVLGVHMTISQLPLHALRGSGMHQRRSRFESSGGQACYLQYGTFVSQRGTSS